MPRDTRMLPPVVHPVSPGRHPGAPPIVHPVQPPVIHPGIPPIVHPVHPGVPSAESPPESHHRHHDYVYLESYGWWPSWYPYWEPYWFTYWQYLYDYFGGDAYPEYAEYARDTVLRQIAPQWGWL